MRIGIDLGGTKIEGIVMGDRGEILVRERIATPRDDYAATLRAIHDLVVAFESRVGADLPLPVGLGTPGAISPSTGRMKNANSTWLNDRPLADDLERKLGRPVRIANDANCFALSEAVDGAAAGATIVFGVILGTGVGGGVVVRGSVLTGADAIAGEWGHNPLPAPEDDERPGPLCYCGRRGCIETFLSGPGLSADHALHEGETLAAEEIAMLAKGAGPGGTALRPTPDPAPGSPADGGPDRAAACERSLLRYASRLARALAGVINILDPDVIVLGGGLSRIDRLYVDIPRHWGGHVFSDRVATKLVPPKHGDSSGVRGAAWLWSPGAPVDPAAGGASPH